MVSATDVSIATIRRIQHATHRDLPACFLPRSSGHFIARLGGRVRGSDPAAKPIKKAEAEYSGGRCDRWRGGRRSRRGRSSGSTHKFPAAPVKSRRDPPSVSWCVGDVAAAVRGGGPVGAEFPGAGRCCLAEVGSRLCQVIARPADRETMGRHGGATSVAALSPRDRNYFYFPANNFLRLSS